jgi:signal transduction histidine kinase
METITAAQAGDLAVRSRDSSRDEIGRLSRSFNRMIERISSEHASRLKALGTLAAGVAHQVRNPLNSIAMTIKYLRDTIGPDSDSEAQECLDVMTQQVEELDRIVEEFLQLTLPVEMNWRMVDLHLFLDDLMRSFASSLEIANVKLMRDYSKDPLYAKIDPDKLRQAISNVIINSIQAMPDGGELRIATTYDAAQNAVVIEINDTGVGIPQENIDRLFEPYFTTKSDGTGLGLPITYKLIEAHGGEIRVESEEGQGTSFIVTISAGS